MGYRSHRLFEAAVCVVEAARVWAACRHVEVRLGAERTWRVSREYVHDKKLIANKPEDSRI